MRFWAPLTFGMLAASVVLCPAAHAAALDAGNTLSIGVTRGAMSETYAPQDVDVRVPFIERYLLRAAWSLAEDNHVVLKLNRSTYPLVDPDFPDAVHLRTETSLMIGDAWDTTLLGGVIEAGMGWAAHAYETENTAIAPGTDPAYLFNAFQLQHGPIMSLNYRHAIAGPVGFALDTDVMPYAFASMSETRLSALPWLVYVASSARFTFFDGKFGLGYYYERTTGSTFNRESSGVLGTVTLAGL